MTHLLAGTGSSKAPRTAAIHDWIASQFERVGREHPGFHVLSGGALGWDAALAYVAHRERVPYHLCLPSQDYGAYYWARAGLAIEFANLCAMAASIEYVRPSHVGANGKPGHANFDRNARMVERADEFLVYDAGSSGTRHCVGLIQRAGKPMVAYPVEREEKSECR